jgi:hypothetical protein
LMINGPPHYQIRPGPITLLSPDFFFQKYHLYKSKFVKGGPFFRPNAESEDQFYSETLTAH